MLRLHDRESACRHAERLVPSLHVRVGNVSAPRVSACPYGGWRTARAPAGQTRLLPRRPHMMTRSIADCPATDTCDHHGLRTLVELASRRGCCHTAHRPGMRYAAGVAGEPVLALGPCRGSHSRPAWPSKVTPACRSPVVPCLCRQGVEGIVVSARPAPQTHAARTRHGATSRNGRAHSIQCKTSPWHEASLCQRQIIGTRARQSRADCYRPASRMVPAGSERVVLALAEAFVAHVVAHASDDAARTGDLVLGGAIVAQAIAVVLDETGNRARSLAAITVGAPVRLFATREIVFHEDTHSAANRLDLRRAQGPHHGCRPSPAQRAAVASGREERVPRPRTGRLALQRLDHVYALPS